LTSILAQRSPCASYEIIIADAGSSDDTLAIATRLGADRIVGNPLKTGEAGKTAGIKASAGDVIALVDSDNVLPDDRWLERMLAPFADPQIVASEPLEYTARAGDPALTRYFRAPGHERPALSVHGQLRPALRGHRPWSGLAVPHQDCGDYLKLTLSEEALPTIGANGFVFRRALLDQVEWDPYFFDIDVMHQAVRPVFVMWLK
jgi:glycosyltransferase involved in cell wall biosynthesis